jgi:signal transduction histidine kinase
MNPVARLRAWAGEASLQRRSVAYVMVAFLLVWAVLVGYQYLKYERMLQEEQPFRRFGSAVLQSLDEIPDSAQAAAALRSTEQWVNVRRRENGRLPGRVQFELRDRQGGLIHSSIDPRIGPHLDYEGHGQRWNLRVAEPKRSARSFVAYNLPFIGEYLLLALPFVLLPVWWSVRRGLRPLEDFAAGIAARRPHDLRPLAEAPRHRELKPLASALDGLLGQLRDRFDRERSFVQDAAHELRTPLAVVMTQAHVMAHAASPEDRGRAHVLLHQAVERASHLAQQLLLLASLDSAGAVPPRRVDVAQALREMLAQLAPLAMQREIDLSLEAPECLWATVDEAALQSIAVNLVDNAIRYGRAGGAVLVRLADHEERVTLQVKDDGPGIPEAERALVFERFYRAAGQEASGSGLGLAIVRQAAARLRGHVSFSEGLGGAGVGLNVTIPVAEFRPG